jgi:hypothetical protein
VAALGKVLVVGIDFAILGPEQFLPRNYHKATLHSFTCDIPLALPISSRLAGTGWRAREIHTVGSCPTVTISHPSTRISSRYPATQQSPTFLSFHRGCSGLSFTKVLTMDAQALKQGRCSLVAEALRTWGVLKIRATGVSMLPTLWPGDLLTVQSRRLEEIEPGEIVLYRRRNRFFIHRAVSKCLIGDGLFLIARGDSMPEADPPVRIGQVLGKITEVERDGSVFLPGRRLSPLRRMVGYMFCHWGLFRRVGLRLWGRRRDDDQIEVAIVEAAS